VAPAPAIAAANAPSRLARLDGLRGLAACLVAFTYHAHNLFAPGALETGVAAIDWFRLYGYLFVDLFFLLSGYIFAHVYLGRAHSFGQADLADFAVARIARLYPLHVVLLLATAALFWGRPENTPLAFAAHLAMLQAFVVPVAHTFVGPSWSLSVEAVCYVLFACAAAAGPRRLKQVTGIAVAAGLILLLAHHSAGGAYTRDNLPRGLLGFFLGQVLWHQRARLARVPASTLWGILAVGVLFPREPFGAILPYALLVFPAALLLGLRLGWLGSRPLVWLGDRSYAIYLIHLPLLELVVQQQGRIAGAGWKEALGFAGFVAGTLLLANLALRFIEHPARAAIRAGWQRWQRSAAPLVPA